MDDKAILATELLELTLAGCQLEGIFLSQFHRHDLWVDDRQRRRPTIGKHGVLMAHLIVNTVIFILVVMAEADAKLPVEVADIIEVTRAGGTRMSRTWSNYTSSG
jgi:hypothetical protein